jgi:hypothetical protein
MKLYVDDLRVLPDGNWTLARTNSEAIRLLATGYVEEISCDHDILLLHAKIDDFSYAVLKAAEHLGYAIPTERGYNIAMSDETFQPVIYYLCAMKAEFRPKVITLHTANVDAGKRMVALLKDNGIEATYKMGSYHIDFDKNESDGL